MSHCGASIFNCASGVPARPSTDTSVTHRTKSASAARARAPLTPSFGAVADQSLQLLKGLPTLCRRLGGDEIAQSLHRGEIELAVFESAPRKFAGFSHAAPRHRAERLEHPGDNRMTTMQLQF